MDKYKEIISHENFSKYTLNITKYPKSLKHWEILLDYLLDKTGPINKNIDQRLYKLITKVYDSLLSQFPYLENYHIDYALFEYKLSHITKFHKIFDNALYIFNNRSLLIWVSYLSKCNEVINDNKKIFQLYESAELYIGLHYLSGEFWDLYLDQLKNRCQTKKRYYIVLRKLLEIPNHSFSKYFAMWFKEIDNIQDLSTLKYLVSTEDIKSKLKININTKGRRGLVLLEAKKKIIKYSKDLYFVLQHQVNEIYSLFESKITVHHFTSQDTLISTQEIEIWIKYLNYTIELRNNSLIHLNFQRALTVLASYEQIWLMYSEWLINHHDDSITAKSVLLKGLNLCNNKTGILRELYAILVKLNDYNTLNTILFKVEKSFHNFINCNNFDIFWDYIQYKTFICKNISHSRYSGTHDKSILPTNILDVILSWLKEAEKKQGQFILLNYIITLQNKDNTAIIEDEVFKYIIKENISFYVESSEFWELYCRLIYFDPSLSYLNRRRRIVEIWEELKKYRLKSVHVLLNFCETYLSEEIETIRSILSTDNVKIKTTVDL